MKLPVSYEDALARYPDAVRSLLVNRKRSKAKTASLPPEELDWYIEWSVATKGRTFAEVLGGMITPEPKPEDDIERDLDEYMSCVVAGLTAKKGRGVWSSEPIEEDVSEIRAWQRANLEEQYAERVRIARLTPEERAREEEAALAQLRGTPGFTEVPLPAPQPGANHVPVRTFARGHHLFIFEPGGSVRAMLDYTEPREVPGMKVPRDVASLEQPQMEALVDRVIAALRATDDPEVADLLGDVDTLPESPSPKPRGRAPRH